MEPKQPNLPTKCTWKPNATNSPHSDLSEPNNRKKVLPNILSAIGQTPMVQLNNVTQSLGIKCQIFAKCEFLNPGGSVKDRIGYRMIQEAEAKGYLKPGCTIIEPTSGNTGIGLAMAAAAKGYKCLIVMPQKMSDEKVSTLRILGAEIIRTPTEAAWDSPEGHIKTAQRLQKQIPNSIILDQYTNPGNPLAHYDQTATEILEQCEGKIDYIVVGAGTGGTISGIGRKFKELSPHTKIVAVDPYGSILAEPPELNDSTVQFYDVEGIGYDFIPTVLDRNVIDMWVKTKDIDSFNIARRLIKEEGLLCGGSSGAAMSAALTIAKDLSEDKRIVVILPDGIRNYMTKFVNDLWMESRNYMDPPEPEQCNEWWWKLPVSKVFLDKPIIIAESTTCGEAVKILQNGKLHQAPVLDNKGDVKGLITLEQLLSNFIAGEIKKTDSIEKVLIKNFNKVASVTTLGKLSRILQKDHYVLIDDEKNSGNLTGILTKLDFVNFIFNESNGMNIKN